jgi:hypothetical protein
MRSAPVAHGDTPALAHHGIDAELRVAPAIFQRGERVRVAPAGVRVGLGRAAAADGLHDVEFRRADPAGACPRGRIPPTGRDRRARGCRGTGAGRAAGRSSARAPGGRPRSGSRPRRRARRSCPSRERGSGPRAGGDPRDRSVSATSKRPTRRLRARDRRRYRGGRDGRGGSHVPLHPRRDRHQRGPLRAADEVAARRQPSPLSPPCSSTAQARSIGRGRSILRPT